MRMWWSKAATMADEEDDCPSRICFFQGRHATMDKRRITHHAEWVFKTSHGDSHCDADCRAQTQARLNGVGGFDGVLTHVPNDETRARRTDRCEQRPKRIPIS